VLRLCAVLGLFAGAVLIVPKVIVPENERNGAAQRYEPPADAPSRNINPTPARVEKPPPTLPPGRHYVTFAVTWGPAGGLHPDLISYGWVGRSTVIDARKYSHQSHWSTSMPYVPGMNYFVMSAIYGKPYTRSTTATIGIDGHPRDHGAVAPGSSGTAWAWIGLPPVGNWALPPGGGM
jgi:hypothetical protein